MGYDEGRIYVGLLNFFTQYRDIANITKINFYYASVLMTSMQRSPKSGTQK